MVGNGVGGAEGVSGMTLDPEINVTIHFRDNREKIFLENTD